MNETAESDIYTNKNNLYEEVLNDETTLDLSSKNLENVPIISNKMLCVLYLQNNKLTSLPDDFFPSLPNLKWLDLRDNELTSLPPTIQEHASLTHLLLQNNKITELPSELGTLPNLKVLQLNGNPIVYPPKEIISAGIGKILSFLFEKHFDDIFKHCKSDLVSEDTVSNYTNVYTAGRSYNSVLEDFKTRGKMSVMFVEKDIDSDEEYYSKISGKCPKLAKSRIGRLYQSSKYVRPVFVASKVEQTEKIKRSFLKDAALKKHKDLLAAREKIIQDRKNVELLRNWRTTYRHKQLTNRNKEFTRTFPYDTHPDYMTLLSRDDIERDLPDKYRKRLVRKCKPTVPRKGTSDVHLAMKIKQLFENLEQIDLNRDTMTPRTEQKVLLGEIQKISEIKQKLMELSTTNARLAEE